MKGAFYGGILGVLLTGCVTVGNPQAVNDRAVSLLTSSPHQMRDVLRLLGAPTGAGRPADAGRPARKPIHVWTYDYTRVDMTPATYLPLVGPFLGSSPVTSGALTLRFDDGGTLQELQQAPRFEDAPLPGLTWPDWLAF